MEKKIDATFSDIFNAIDPKNLTISDNINMPNDFYRHLLDYVLERSYLNRLSERKIFVDCNALSNIDPKKITWLKIMRLPIHPNEQKEYDLLTRWQGVLSTLHTWGHRLIFLLQRKNGETSIYLGTASLSRDVTPMQAIEQFKEATMSSMPGIDLYPMTNRPELQKFSENLLEYTTLGAITGIPSIRKNSQFGILQTLDQLAFGIRDINGNENDYSLMVVAEPLDDEIMSETISRFRRLGSEVHSDVMKSITDTQTMTETKGSNLGVAAIIATCLGIPAQQLIGIASMFSKSTQKSFSNSKATMTQYLDKFAQYAEELTDRHCDRLKRGRNLGFWNVGIYALGKSRKDINTVMGMLRSIYSGDESFIEPIRVHMLKENSGAINIVRRGELIPLVSDEANVNDILDEWNIFGKPYQYLSTPMNTEELSIATSLPRRDVPGLRFVKTSVRFANNPANVEGDTICLGKVVDTGVVQNNEYRIDPNALVRHAVITGSTGSGKSTTCKTIIKEILDRDIPALIVEPAKDDYVRWAIEYNKKLDLDNSLTAEEKDKKKFNIYMPGVEYMDETEISRLKLNPFQPAGIKDAPIDMLTRCEQVTSIINASLPMSDVLPVLIDESLYKYLYEIVGEEFLNSEMTPLKDYPRLDGVTEKARRVLAARGYDKKVQDDIGAALETRFNYLTRGKRGNILNVNNSTSFDKLFSRPTVINLSRIANTKDKSLIMSILMLSLYEYRMSAYTYDRQYREKAQENKLLHLTVIEEAHNLLLKPSVDVAGVGNPQQVVADLFSNILSEIRGYGQGIMIVDQIPTRLVQDAVKNTNYKIVHRLTSPDDCNVMASGLALRQDQQYIIPTLGVGDAIICGDLDDAAAWVRINKSQNL